MIRRVALPRRLLAFLLFLQVVLAPALCLAHAGGILGSGVEICTAEGLRVVHLGPDGSPTDQAPSAAHDGFCPVCHALPQAAGLDAPVLPAPAWVLAVTAWDAPGLAAPPPAIRGPPSGARAPPSLLS